jgi:hypothetical protein
MRRLLLVAFLFVAPSHAFAVGAVACGQLHDGRWLCVSSFDDSTQEAARAEAIATCQLQIQPCNIYADYRKACVAVGIVSNQYVVALARKTIEEARATVCNEKTGCQVIVSKCDTTDNSFLEYFDPINLGAVANGILFGLGIIIALIAFAARAPLINFVIHGNLPYKLPVYGQDIQCLFKRTQRVNWYGRVVFGIVANLAMTHQQLIDIRKYWLGRVIAFDSLRRQRQNQLASMHAQLAATAKSEAHDKKKFWSRRWATLRSLCKKLFWVIIALFNLIMAFFFIRVTLAKLVRGTVVESNDLVLLLQAKEAIEESTTYLREYLTTANSFDDRDEIYEPE